MSHGLLAASRFPHSLLNSRIGNARMSMAQVWVVF